MKGREVTGFRRALSFRRILGLGSPPFRSCLVGWWLWRDWLLVGVGGVKLRLRRLDWRVDLISLNKRLRLGRIGSRTITHVYCSQTISPGAIVLKPTRPSFSCSCISSARDRVLERSSRCLIIVMLSVLRCKRITSRWPPPLLNFPFVQCQYSGGYKAHWQEPAASYAANNSIF